MATLIVVGICLEVIMAALAARIADRKGLAPGGYFLAGLVLGIVGVVIAALARPATVAAGGAPLDTLERLVALHREGALSDDEFATAKTKLLGRR